MTIRLRAFAAAALAALVLAQAAHAATRYDPRLRFRALATPRFTIYYHQGEEALARRLAAIAEDVADRLRRQLGSANGRVHVVLVDQNDISNGWAIPAPYNLIEITAAAPPGESTIGNTDDWLRLVFSHEYTHIVHLDKARGWIGGLRGVFGRAPVLYPNLTLPLWQIEGIATYSESALTGEGRVPAEDFRLIIDRAAAAHRFDPVDRASGGLVDWPGGAGQYAYGAYFHQYLADRFGPESIARLAEETSGRFPYLGSRAFRKVFGQPLGALWDDFEADARRRAREETAAGTRLTHHGFSVSAPSFSRSGRLFYAVANPHGFPSLMEYSREGAPRTVATRYLGGQTTTNGDVVIFDQLEIDNSVALRSDLYAVAAAGGAVRRLTDRARAADPDLSPDGRTIVCTVQAADRRALATMPLPGPGETARVEMLASAEGVHYTSPRWSPDGRRVAAARRIDGGASEIVVVDVATREVRSIVSSPRARNVTPFWLSGSTLLFSSDRDGGPFGIYSVDLDTRAIRKLAGAGLSAQAPVVSPDGREIVYVGYTADGYDLFSLPLPSARWVAAAEPSAPAPSAVAPPTVPSAIPATPYRPWRTLAPQFWMPILESDNGEASGGLTTGGTDALGRHGYAASVAWTTSRLRPDWLVAYAYDRWRPTLFASMSDDTDPWRDGEVRTREVDAGAILVTRKVRHTRSLLAEFNAAEEAFACGSCPTPVEGTTRRRAVRLGWRFDNSRTYGYSVSRESGTVFRVTWETAPEALGSDAGTGATTLDARGYRRLGPRHAALAARIAAASAWGDRQARRVFSAAGAGPQTDGFDFGIEAVGLLRGLDADAVAGDRVAVANVDYRFPLRTLQRGVGTAPVFFRTLHGALFADAGNAWSGAFQRRDIRMTVGAELSLDTVVAYSLPLTFVTGVAWRDDPVGGRRGLAAFGRIGRAF